MGDLNLDMSNNKRFQVIPAVSALIGAGVGGWMAIGAVVSTASVIGITAGAALATGIAAPAILTAGIMLAVGFGKTAASFITSCKGHKIRSRKMRATTPITKFGPTQVLYFTGRTFLKETKVALGFGLIIGLQSAKVLIVNPIKAVAGLFTKSEADNNTNEAPVANTAKSTTTVPSTPKSTPKSQKPDFKRSAEKTNTAEKAPKAKAKKAAAPKR